MYLWSYMWWVPPYNSNNKKKLHPSQALSVKGRSLRGTTWDI